MLDTKSASVIEIFKRALETILARVFASAPEASTVTVAYSGGLDSSALLHLARAYAAEHGIALFAFHIHHGLSPNADAWLAHCRDTCTRLGIGFDARQVHVPEGDKRGLEAAARSARYAALGELCREHGVPLLLTAHHQDDQAETVLLQMLRGAGPAGLSGMDQVNTAPDLLGDATLLIARPLLSVPRARLAAYVQNSGIVHIEDESNLNSHHPRNALRNDILPILGARFPAYRDCIARSAEHAQSAQRLLDEFAAHDLAACLEGDALNVKHLTGLSEDRVDNLLRHWLALHGLRMPTTAWLHEAREQLLDAREDAQVCVIHGEIALRRYRNRIMLTPTMAETDDIAPVVFNWNGETSMHFPAYGGVLHFDQAETGVDAAWLRQQSLRLQYRTGGGRLKLAANRSTRSLKEHYQALGVPAWERQHLPLVYVGETLLFAAGIGQACQFPSDAPGACIRLRWER